MEERIFYEIYVPSFFDSNGDGVGDLKGIESKLEYLKEIGVGGIWLTPFYKSPKVDNGYDIADYYSVDELYGSLADIDQLLEKAKKLDIKVIVDMVINHTSVDHEWFVNSETGNDDYYKDFYIWKEEIPNNWESFFTGNAWEYSVKRDAYYYHAFSKEQACLNWTNPNVRKEIYKVLDFWLERGVDGFRFDVINFLKVNSQSFELQNLSDETKTQVHEHDVNQPGILEEIKRMVAHIRSRGDYFLVGEVGSDDLEVLKRYVGKELLDVVFNFNLGSIEKLDLDLVYDNLVKMHAIEMLPTLFFSSHDMSRAFNRLCNGNEKLFQVLLGLVLTYKGVPFIYQGEEWCSHDFEARSISEVRDVQAILCYEQKISEGCGSEESFCEAMLKNRDRSRSPLFWSVDENPVMHWLPMARSGQSMESQKMNKDSFLNDFIELASVRNKEVCLHMGIVHDLNLLGEVLTFKRTYENETIEIWLNFSGDEVPVNESGNPILYSNIIHETSVLGAYEILILKEEN